ncbi:MAG: hypothetical protein M1828_005440 [Chrysothrix sp. TS-e1954]|nr:MAG: hypothetical protein M1828_005440 [Chrysothrix sp. TS-e1954]
MDVSKLLSEPGTLPVTNPPAGSSASTSQSPYATRQNSSYNAYGYSGYTSSQASPTKIYGPSPQPPKVVNFPLSLSGDFQQQARLPLRVNVNPSDTTDSIISTVKNFYGLYEGQGVSFEDGNGLTMIPCYENLSAHGTVQVRLVQENVSPNRVVGSPYYRTPASPRVFLDGNVRLTAPGAQSFSWPDKGTTKARSLSPSSRRMQRDYPSRDSSITRGRDQRSRDLFIDTDAARNYSDDDGTSVSVSSSKKARSELLASAEISLDNIVEGNRRQGIKFESSVLPLYVPPQIPQPASMSSESPVKKMMNPQAASPAFNQMAVTSNSTLPSPQSFGRPETFNASRGHGKVHLPGHSQRLRAPRTSGDRGNSFLPTPDPTVNSTISDEDVALQLMRLGDVSQFHGRTSASTLDEALSGKAELASSVSESGDEYADGSVSEFSSSREHAVGPPKKRQKGMHTSKASPLSNSVPASRQDSTGATQAQVALGIDEEDLSAKPRCQRCRKSKKGCDRQRPCQRCKDAGIGIEGCVSEDEGNGRKGRYGRVMGVPVKKGSLDGFEPEASPFAPAYASMPPPRAVSGQEVEKSKKRKR